MARRPGNGDSDDARRKRPANGDRGGAGGRYGGGRGDGKRDDGDSDDDSGEHQIFENMVQRRMGGGARPSAAAYARALRLWQQMPGAIGFTAVPDLPDEPSPDEPPGGVGQGGQPRPPRDSGSDDGGAR